MSQSKSKSEKKSFFKDWLEQLQQESWQLELLISGLALFGIWESQTLLQRFDYFIEVHSISTFRTYLRTVLFVLESGWTIFLTNLLIHIILRGFWIGAIGLRYVSGDIDYDELNYSDRFRNYFIRTIGDFDEYIEKIEKASSVIFSFTFLLFFLLLSFILYFTVLGIMTELLVSIFFSDVDKSDGGVMGIAGMIYFLFGVVFVIDFLTMGAFKRIKDPTVSRIYFYAYRFISLITLSFISRPLLLNFMDNRYTRRLIYFAIPFIFILIFGARWIQYDRYPLMPDIWSSNTSMETLSNSIHWNSYDEMRVAHLSSYARDSENPPKEKINIASLSSYEVEQGKDFKLFIEYKEGDEERINDAHKELRNFRIKDFGLKKFWKARSLDKEESEIRRQKLTELKLMRRAARDKGYDGQDENELSLFNSYKQYTKEDIQQLESEINRVYDKKLMDYESQKLKEIIQGLLSFNIVRIDGEIINDQMECKFYLHDNLHERGILCYISSDSLDLGEHMLSIDKENCNKCDGLAKKIPFRIIK